MFTPAAASTPAGGKRRIPSEYLDGDDEAVSEHLVALEERLASLITDSITPRLLPDLEILPYRKTHVVAVQVFPSPTRPRHLARAGLQNGTYVRVGGGLNFQVR